MTTKHEALILALRKAIDEVERARRAFIAPYSGDSAAQAYFTAVGVSQGLGIAIEIYEREDGDA